jgi:hypothetical protein
MSAYSVYWEPRLGALSFEPQNFRMLPFRFLLITNKT